MDKQVLQNIVIDQKELFSSRAGLIERDVMLDKFLTTNQVVVISGVRRCGKSSLLSIIKNRLELQESEFCYLNFDDERITAEIGVLSDLYAIHLELYRKEPVFFFDEIQLVDGWEKFVNRMYEQGRKVYVTGSNARLLSSEISTSLTGRTKVLELFPFSFAEFMRFSGRSYDMQKLSVRQLSLLKNDMNTYLSQGGFPLILKENDIELINSWFQDILYRDIVARYRITSVAEVRQIALYLASNIGKIFSYATLQSISGIKSVSSVKDYLHYYESSYLFFYLRKFDYSVKKQIMNSRKVYTIDNAVAIRIGFRFSENSGRLMENAVFIELKRRNKDVFYHAGKYECDFLVTENLTVVEAIQVTYELKEVNIKREINGLKEAMQQFNISHGSIITFEQENYAIELPANIEIIPLYKWLTRG
ncbi:MAG: hypothetical protein FD155_2825 [Bacteroidetes bacterium]|nr:MAG: hypothetical protein FD155_2825 [Bacteroidota bacterium]